MCRHGAAQGRHLLTQRARHVCVEQWYATVVVQLDFRVGCVCEVGRPDRVAVEHCCVNSSALCEVVPSGVTCVNCVNSSALLFLESTTSYDLALQVTDVAPH